MTTHTKKVYFLLFFIIFGLISQQIKFTQLVGADVKFTLFDFFAPVAGAFLGGALGILTVLFLSLINLAFAASIELGAILRLFPILFGVYFFSKTTRNQFSKSTLLIPALCMFLFWLHPEGRKAWVYALFWTVPILATIYNKNLYLRSLGATFTTHAVGSVVWAWTFNLPASAWQTLIPITASERLLFAGGIAVTYLLYSKALSFAVRQNFIPATFVKNSAA